MACAEEVEAAVRDRFTQSGKMVAVEIGHVPQTLARPGINVAVESGTYQTLGNRTSELRERMDITLVFVVKNVRLDAESRRRKVIHPLVRFAVAMLWLETLGLDIEPILPTSWRETTTVEQLAKGELVVELTLSTHTSFSRHQDPEILLQGIDAIYQPPDSPAADSVTDTITLESESP